MAVTKSKKAVDLRINRNVFFKYGDKFIAIIDDGDIVYDNFKGIVFFEKGDTITKMIYSKILFATKKTNFSTFSENFSIFFFFSYVPFQFVICKYFW